MALTPERTRGDFFFDVLFFVVIGLLIFVAAFNYGRNYERTNHPCPTEEQSWDNTHLAI